MKHAGGRPSLFTEKYVKEFEAKFRNLEEYLRQGFSTRQALKKTEIANGTLYRVLKLKIEYKNRFIRAQRVWVESQNKLRETKTREQIFLENIEDRLVYIIKIKGLDYYKIGMSYGFKNRLIALQTVLPFELEVVMLLYSERYDKLESDLHKRFSHKCIKGEWFQLIGDDILKLQQVERYMKLRHVIY